MVTHDHSHELRHQLDAELQAIRTGLVEMGTLVVENVRRAGDAVLDSRLEGIGEVRDGDRPVNELYAELERRTFEVLALQQPLASDLRLLVASVRILYEMERSGDLAVNIVNCLERQRGFVLEGTLRETLRSLFAASAALFAQAVDAIAALEEDAGPRLDRADDEVDDLTSTLFHQIHAESERMGLDAAIELTRVGRFIERIADHAVNIAENVTYVVTGRFPEDPPPT